MHHHHVLLSIAPLYADLILARAKRVEVRVGRVHWTPGDWVWLYATRPVRAVVGVALVGRLDTAPAAEILGEYGRQACLDVGEFTEYTKDRRGLWDPNRPVTAIALACPVALSAPVGLDVVDGRPAPRRWRTLRPCPPALRSEPAVVRERVRLRNVSERLRDAAGPGGR